MFDYSGILKYGKHQYQTHGIVAAGRVNNTMKSEQNTHQFADGLKTLNLIQMVAVLLRSQWNMFRWFNGRHVSIGSVFFMNVCNIPWSISVLRILDFIHVYEKLYKMY